MNRKNIKANLSRKFNAWVDTIDDLKVKDLVRSNSIISGGAIASLLMGETPNDYDVYFRNRETTLAVAFYYLKKFRASNAKPVDTMIVADGYGRELTLDGTPVYANKDPGPESQVVPEGLDLEDRVQIFIKSAGIASEVSGEVGYQYFERQDVNEEAGEYVGKVMQDVSEIEEVYDYEMRRALNTKTDKFAPAFLSTNAISLTDGVQLILRFYGEPEEILANYDFVHCTNYWESRGKELVLKQDALEAILAKELKYVGSKYPLCSIMRMRKFIDRGWWINAGQILKMSMQVSNLDLTNHLVLKDQLIGVDSAYFSEVLTKLKDKEGNRVDSTYLVEIIDRMF